MKKGNLMNLNSLGVAVIVFVITFMLLISVFGSVDTNVRTGLTGAGAAAAGNF